jgi:hypothetical protein
MTAPLPSAGQSRSSGQPGMPEAWLRLARLARLLSWITLAWMGIEGGIALAVFAGLAANTLFGAWWLDGVVALGIAVWAVIEGRRAWAGKSCDCTCQPGQPC